MNAEPEPPRTASIDDVMQALGTAVFASQVFESTMLEVIAATRELLKGSFDGKEYQSSIDSFSRNTLGQLLNALRKHAELNPAIDEKLIAGLDARNQVVHRFATDVGDQLFSHQNLDALRKALYEKCSLIMEANVTAVAILHAVVDLVSERGSQLVTELSQVAEKLSLLGSSESSLKH
jgi:hypothetical protein